MNNTHKGGCICGDIRYEVIGNPLRVTVCHCTWCQRRTGSAFAIEPIFLKDQVNVATDNTRKFRHISDESGRWVELNFCPCCGTNIGLTLEVAPDSCAIDAGTFDDPSWIRSDTHDFRHIFIRSTQNWCQIPDDVNQYEKHFRK